MCGQKPRNSRTLHLELARCLEQLLSTLAHRLSLERAGATLGIKVDPELIKSLLDSGLAILERCDAFDVTHDSNHAASAAWCRSRMLIHSAILGVAESPDKWPQGVRLLNDAEACLHAEPIRRRNADLAIVECYRAELFLLRAGGHSGFPSSLFSSDHKVTVRDTIGAATWTNWQERCLNWRVEGKQYRNQLTGSKSVPHLRAARALVDDAIRFLDRADAALLKTRKNINWITWSMQRRIQAIGMSVWLSLADPPGATIPFIGYDSAARSSSTIADEILSQCLRLVRMDCYRLATVVDAYATCMVGLHVRLVCDSTHPRMAARQRDMFRNFDNARQRLNQLYSRRKAWSSDKYWQADASISDLLTDARNTSGRDLQRPENTESDVRKRIEESGEMSRYVDKYIDRVCIRANRVVDRGVLVLMRDLP